MKSGRFAEAEEVYRDDLARLPDNGWSLYGLVQEPAYSPARHAPALLSFHLRVGFNLEFVR